LRLEWMSHTPTSDLARLRLTFASKLMDLEVQDARY
jgi:hypothetical protein